MSFQEMYTLITQLLMERGISSLHCCMNAKRNRSEAHMNDFSYRRYNDDSMFGFFFSFISISIHSQQYFFRLTALVRARVDIHFFDAI